MKPSASVCALSVPHDVASYLRTNESSSPSSPNELPESHATIPNSREFQACSEVQKQRGGATLPAYQGLCADACERGDVLMSRAEVELTLCISTAFRLTAAAFHKPGVRLDLAKGKWLSVPRRRPLQPRCRTFGCSLPDLHAGLHQVAHPLTYYLPTRAQRPDHPHAPLARWRARFASGG